MKQRPLRLTLREHYSPAKAPLIQQALEGDLSSIGDGYLLENKQLKILMSNPEGLLPTSIFVETVKEPHYSVVMDQVNKLLIGDERVHFKWENPPGLAAHRLSVDRGGRFTVHLHRMRRQ